MTEQCATCKYFGPQLAQIAYLSAYAQCNDPGDAPDYGWVPGCHGCPSWQQREGEPLGTGVSKVWWVPNDPFHQASIVHDLQYDLLSPTDSTAKIDKEWWRNARLLAGDNWALRRAADVGYVVIRAYGIGRVLIGKVKG